MGAGCGQWQGGDRWPTSKKIGKGTSETERYMTGKNAPVEVLLGLLLSEESCLRNSSLS